ncbi:MAG: class I SAM-dependent methyltransferase [Alphaproteobacteria bacterium]
MVATAQQNTLAAYDAIAPSYAEYSSTRQAYLDAVDQLVIEHLKPSARLLDIGSGDGRRLKKITSHHKLTDVVAIEPSENMATICRQSTGFTVHPICGDSLNNLDEKPFDVITVLWNVFGHMPDSSVRLKTLQAMAKKLKPDGIVMLDVNNRHNQLSYGRWNVLKRRIIDAVAFDEKRGDAHYEWKIGDKSFPASGHLFTPAEMQKLFNNAGFKVEKRWSVNYATGAISASPFNGQLFYVLKLR